MKYAHKHTQQLYIMYTKQLEVIIDNKAVHKNCLVFEQNKTVREKTKTKHTVLSGKSKTHCLSRIYTAKRMTTVTQ
jgi:hypothetical protein